MLVLTVGLLLFLGIHSTRIVAEDWRQGQIARRGEKSWKGLYTLVSLASFAMIVWGFGLAQQQPTVLWPTPPTGLKHLASLLTLVAFVLLAAAYVPGNGIKARLGHPMVLSVKVWALAHLLVNNTLADLLLFGGFLLWSVFCFRAARARDRAASSGPTRASGAMLPTLLTVVLGLVLWAGFAFWAHGAWIGVRPFGR
jgi:uncharacterized membrane protein